MSDPHDMTTMTLEEAKDLSKWRPGVHYVTQAEARLRLLVDALAARDAQIAYLKGKVSAAFDAGSSGEWENDFEDWELHYEIDHLGEGI